VHGQMKATFLFSWYLLLLSCWLKDVTSATDATYSRAYTEEATRLRRETLANYDRIVPPVSDRIVSHSAAGTDVYLHIRIFKVMDVEATHGRMQLKVWYRLFWYDERLAWNPEDYGGIQKVWYGDHTNNENAEIWLPDLQPFNAHNGIIGTLDPALAVVNSSGFVTWSRPGALDVMCRFSGLVAFPFDALKCKMEVGGWIMSDGFQGVHAFEGGVSFAKEPTSRSSYQEYEIVEVSMEKTGGEVYLGSNEAWPKLVYSVELERSWTYYIFISLAPSIGFTFLSMGVFFMSHEVGERLSFGITLMLANEVSKYTVMELLPICGETVWMDLFQTCGTFFCALSLVESIIVLYFALQNWNDDMPIATRVFRWLIKRSPRFIKDVLVLEVRPEPKDDADSGGEVDPEFESCAAIMFRKKLAAEKGESSHASNDLNSSKGLNHGRSLLHMERSTDLDSVAKRLIFFERLFDLLDSDARGYIRTRDFARFLSFAKLDLGPEARAVRLRASAQRLMDEVDGIFFCMNFMAVCEDLLGGTPLEQIEVSAQNFQDANTMMLRRNQKFWLSMAQSVDKHARWWIPLSYICCLGFLFNIDLTDPYDDTNANMFSGLGKINMEAAGFVRSMIWPLLLIACLIAWLFSRRRRLMKERATYEKLRKTIKEQPEPDEKGLPAEVQAAEAEQETSGIVPVEPPPQAQSSSTSSTRVGASTERAAPSRTSVEEIEGKRLSV